MINIRLNKIFIYSKVTGSRSRGMKGAHAAALELWVAKIRYCTDNHLISGELVKSCQVFVYVNVSTLLISKVHCNAGR